MSAPLVAVDANPRQPGFKPKREGSKIPSPPRSQRSGSADRRSPFSVSTTGSPCYTATCATSKYGMSHATMSKLPRKSTPTQSAFSKSYGYGSGPVVPRSSLPRARGGPSPSVPSKSNTLKTSPPLSCDKPLPSPPIAQIVNPASPPKPQRTLVDAEAGTPTDEQWPILRPENILLSKHPAFSKADPLGQHSISEASALQRNDVPVLKSRVITPLSVNDRTPSQQIGSPAVDWTSTGEKFQETTGPRRLSSTNPYAQTFHAYSTSNEVALDSPLAYKQQISPGVTVPPRISSKRDSLTLPAALPAEMSSQSPCASFRPVKQGSTKWPVLEDATDVSLGEHPDKEVLSNLRHHLVAEPEPVEPAYFVGADMIQSHFGSIDNASTWSLGPESSLDDGSETRCEGDFRVKRLSGHSYNSESGPILRIFADADAIILGQEDSIPAVPALPEQVFEHSHHERPVSTLAGRISRQMLVKMTSPSGTRTSTPSTTQTEPVETKPVKISPIRSMQPPRELSIGDDSFKSDSASRPVSSEVSKQEGDPVPPQAQPCNSFEPQRDTTLSEPPVANTPKVFVLEKDDDHSSVKPSRAFQNEACEKPMQVPNTNDKKPPRRVSRTRVPTTETASGSASSKSAATWSRTSPFLPSSGRLKAQVSRYSGSSPSSASSRPARSISSQAGVRQSDPPGLRATGGSVIQHPEAVSFRSTIKGTEPAHQSTADTALKMKAKRSLRTIFHRRDPKPTLQPGKKREQKRSSVTGSALAQRIRGSANSSKVSLVRNSEAVAGTEPSATLSSKTIEGLGAVHGHQTTLLPPEPTPVMLPPQLEPVAQHETSIVVHKILDRITSMGEESPDRLRGLEIAEAILHTVECFKEAGLSAELARKHAREAELNADRAGLELKRLAKLCEPSFDWETMQSIKQLFRDAGVVKLPETHVE